MSLSPASGETHGSTSSHGETDSLLLGLLRQVAPENADLPWDAAALQAHTRFQIGPQLGKGGMGIVFQAHDTVLQREVALKLLRDCEPATVARFVREARAQARVEHENVCRVYDVGELAGVPYIAMQLVHGQTLDQLVTQTSIEARVRIMKQVAEGVHAAHRLGLIHRDLKPQNILVELTARGEPWPYVADFGLARDAAGSHTLTLTGQALGTPAYMSPEQVRCEDVDRRADIYSLGATFHHLLVGKPPFSGATPGEVLARVLERPPDPVRRHNHCIPADLEAIVMCCLEKQPQHRYASAHDLAQDLQRYLDGEPVWARRPNLASACRRAIRRHPIVSSIIASSTLALIATIVGLQLLARRELNSRVSHLVAQAHEAARRADASAARARDLHDHAASKFSAGDRDAGETSWRAVLGARSEASRHFEEAGQSLEAAIAVDPGRTDVRALFGDLLLSRVRLAEQDHRSAERDDLFRRLALYDEGGKRLGSLQQPAHLSVDAVPPSAVRTIERYVEDARSQLRLEPAGPASQSSSGDLALPPGSYLVTLSGDGLATVHYPVALGRGESVRVSVTLPRATAIPEGFVYIPSGRFLFGTSVEETYRSILGAPPLHTEWLDGYLIGKREVTVAEFIEYLGSLPAPQRVLPSEHSSTQMLTKLREVSPGVWQYRFDFAAARGYTARTGEKFRYGLRRSNALQDWSRFPIIGLSANDAEAYVAWLSRTRLPGARLCTEKEWERAARGADDREYPHGARLYPDDANFADTYKDKIDIGPDEVGLHPTSRSPFGLDDMVGNAWEYTRSSLSGDRYVVRGGSFSYNATQNRLTVRSGITPSYRGPAHGLRVCAPSPVR